MEQIIFQTENIFIQYSKLTQKIVTSNECAPKKKNTNLTNKNLI